MIVYSLKVQKGKKDFCQTFNNDSSKIGQQKSTSMIGQALLKILSEITLVGRYIASSKKES
jgi:hypothetical protein